MAPVEMAEQQRAEGPGNGGVAPTLGDVLYPDKSRARISEQEWAGLVRSVARQDQLALHALYERSGRIVFTLVMRITANHETAEEVTLDVFHDVWRRASAYDPAHGPVIAWLMNQARSRALDRLRFDGRKKRSADAGEFAEPGVADDSEDALALKQEAEALRGALGVLTADERQAIETAFFADLTYAEAAARLDQPLGTVKTRIRSALQKLRQALAEGSGRP